MTNRRERSRQFVQYIYLLIDQTSNINHSWIGKHTLRPIDPIKSTRFNPQKKSEKQKKQKELRPSRKKKQNIQLQLSNSRSTWPKYPDLRCWARCNNMRFGKRVTWIHPTKKKNTKNVWFLLFLITDQMHVWYISLHENHKNQLHVGKYTIMVIKGDQIRLQIRLFALGIRDGMNLGESSSKRTWQDENEVYIEMIFDWLMCFTLEIFQWNNLVVLPEAHMGQGRLHPKTFMMDSTKTKKHDMLGKQPHPGSRAWSPWRC